MDLIKRKLVCYTIGHSTYESETFVRLLKLNSIQWLIDIRSVPYSKHNAQYNKENIKVFLENNGISYIFMGNLLGARYTNPELFFPDKEMVDFRKVREGVEFKHSIDVVIRGLKEGHKICLMCSEKNPFECHRFVLVSYALAKKGINVKHILGNEIISNEALEEQLLSKYKIEHGNPVLFESVKTKEAAIEEGYIKRNIDIGYVKADVAKIL